MTGSRVLVSHGRRHGRTLMLAWRAASFGCCVCPAGCSICWLVSPPGPGWSQRRNKPGRPNWCACAFVAGLAAGRVVTPGCALRTSPLFLCFLFSPLLLQVTSQFSELWRTLLLMALRISAARDSLLSEGVSTFLPRMALAGDRSTGPTRNKYSVKMGITLLWLYASCYAETGCCSTLLRCI